MPGAELIGRDGDAYKGRVKVKLGPVLAQYEGKASFAEKDDAAKRGVLRAEGRETKGQGNAKATVTASLAAAPEGTEVTVTTDLAIVGRLAQMGRGLIGEVSEKLLGEFVANLEREIAASAAAPPSTAPAMSAASAPPPAPAATEAPRSPAPREAAPVDLLATAGVPVLKRLAPIVIAVALATALVLWLL
jgi:carbon monoxide dehydrogenase subunit G